jgi:predicted TIM-barrel fold metal-dependent hydrolase
MAVIDAHAHFEPRMLEPDQLIRKMDAAGVDRVALIPTMNDPLPETPETLLAVVRALMNSPCHPVARKLNDAFYTKEGHLKLKGKVYEIYPRPDNRAVAGMLTAHPERFLGWIFLNPRLPDDQLEELERWRQVPGFVGVKLHPHWHRYHLGEALPIARRCEELELPILVHLGFAEHGTWPLLTERCPRLKLIFAHAGMPHFSRMWKQVAANEKLHIDVSSPYLSERLVRKAVAAVGPQRVLYGTDAPYGFHTADSSYDYTAIKGWVERLPCRAGAIDGIFGDNVLRLLAEQR